MKPVPLMAREEWAINDGSVPLRVPASAVRQNAAPGGCWHVEIIPLIPGTAVHNASEDSWEKEKRRGKEKKKSRTARTKDGPAGNNARPVIGWAGQSRDHTRGSQSRDPIPNRHDFDFDSKTATSPPSAHASLSLAVSSSSCSPRRSPSNRFDGVRTRSPAPELAR